MNLLYQAASSQRLPLPTAIHTILSKTTGPWKFFMAIAPSIPRDPPFALPQTFRYSGSVRARGGGVTTSISA